MANEPQTAGTNKKLMWAGWAVSALPVAMLLLSAGMKFMRAPQVDEGLAKFGWPATMITTLAVVELSCTIIYLIPKTAVLGAVLLTGYLGGAVATHLRIEDPWYGAAVVGVLVWLGLYLRDARVRALLPLRR